MNDHFFVEFLLLYFTGDAFIVKYNYYNYYNLLPSWMLLIHSLSLSRLFCFSKYLTGKLHNVDAPNYGVFCMKMITRLCVTLYCHVPSWENVFLHCIKINNCLNYCTITGHYQGGKLYHCSPIVLWSSVCFFKLFSYQDVCTT